MSSNWRPGFVRTRRLGVVFVRTGLVSIVILHRWLYDAFLLACLREEREGVGKPLSSQRS